MLEFQCTQTLQFEVVVYKIPNYLSIIHLFSIENKSTISTMDLLCGRVLSILGFDVQPTVLRDVYFKTGQPHFQNKNIVFHLTHKSFPKGLHDTLTTLLCGHVIWTKELCNK